ncbi:MAG: hypothetical protein IT370_25325 [Deltaproteobacteria bacterium]|nr:hypothetical protein [Deltaproteobacteria bacterium]
MRGLLMVAVLVVAGGACSKQARRDPGGSGGTPGTGEALAPGVVQARFQLREAVRHWAAADRQLASVAIVFIAELEGPRGRAAVVWPAFQGAQIIDNDVIALVFEREGAGWRQVGEEIGPMRGDDSMAELHQRLGGPPRLSWPDGPQPALVASNAVEAARRFDAALASGRTAAAVSAAEDYLRSFGPGMVVYDNDGIDLLIDSPIKRASSIELRDFQPSGDRASALGVMTVDGTERSGPVQLVRRGSGWAIDRLGD